MVKMLVISDIIKQKEIEWKKSTDISNVEIFSWSSETPRISDYEIVILDMNVSYNKADFFNKRDDVYRLLNSGGVIICLTFFNKSMERELIFRNYHHETNYDWLNDSDQIRLGIWKDEGLGKNILITTKNQLVKSFLEGVNEYHKTINGISYYDEKTKIPYISFDVNKNYRFDIFAINKVTKEPVACAIQYNRGSLIFLPQNSDINNYGFALIVVNNLYDIGKEFYEKNLENIGTTSEVPIWINKYISNQEIDLEIKIKRNEEDLEKLRYEHKRFEIIDFLLYGYNKQLEKSVKKVFEEFGCEVEETEEGATIDLKIRYTEKNFKFAIEVTGIKDKLFKDNSKFGQILQYIPHKEDDEKIVLIVNTYRDKDFAERDKENFTSHVLDIANSNKFCLMTTADIFNLWKDCIDGKKSKEEILKSIFETNGEYIKK